MNKEQLVAVPVVVLPLSLMVSVTRVLHLSYVFVEWTECQLEQVSRNRYRRVRATSGVILWRSGIKTVVWSAQQVMEQLLSITFKLTDVLDGG